MGMVDFVSPSTGAPLSLVDGALASPGGERFPIERGVPRFVAREGYAESFGFQWNTFSSVQLDSRTGVPASRARLERCLGRPLASLAGRRVLEAGCGAGRFTEILVETGAFVHAIDLSAAVDANLANVGERASYRVAQADILAPPFPPEAFDVVLCLGVLQHLPSPEDAIRSLWTRVAPGGTLAIDHYRRTIFKFLRLAVLYRRLLRGVPPGRALRATNRLVDWFFPLHWAFRRHRWMQHVLGRVSPCIVFFHVYPDLDRRTHLELTRLDAFDQLTDAYKHFRTPAQIRRTLESLGAVEIEVRPGGNGVEARCRKPPR